MRSTNVDETAARSESLYTRSFVLLLATQSSYGMAFSTFFLLPKYLELSLHATEVELGNVSSVGALAGVAAFPLVGMLNDRYGRRPFMLLGSLLITLSALALLRIDEVGTALYAVRLLQGASFALLFNSAATLMSERVPHQRLGVALGVFGSSMLVTNALAPAFAELLAARFDWHVVFWTASGWGALSLLLGLLVHEEARPAQLASDWSKSLSLFRDPRTRVVVLAIAGAGAGFGTVFTFHQPYALRVGITQLSGFFIAYAGSALLGRMVLLHRIDHLDRQKVSAAAMFVYALAVVATSALRPGLLEAIGFSLGLAHGVLYTVFNALAIADIAPAQRGSMMALYHGGFNLGMAIALVVGGEVVETFGYTALFCGTGVVTALAAWGLLRSTALRDTRA